MMLTLMCDDVQPPPAPNSYVYYRSESHEDFIRHNLRTGKTVDNAVVDGALLYWYNLADNNMDANATYTSILNGFAQVIYYKSTYAGCAVAPLPCSYGKPNGFACVFNNQPQIGKALYPVTSKPKQGTGCSNNPSTCPSVNGKASSCNDGLCETAAANVTFPPNATPITALTSAPATARTTTSRAAATFATSSSTTTTTAPTTKTATAGVITKDIQDMIVSMHNNLRMMVARGAVRNGKSGVNLPQGANLNELRYDQLLGADAQAYAESCPTSAVPTINNYAYGQNMLIIYTVRKAYSDLIKMAIRFWSEEIHNNMMNSNMNFTDFVVKRPTPPISFTQMVWANHKTVGCGAHRCGSYTVIVCRYKPGGNIIGEFVYNVGPPCSACQYGCNNQSLCIVPVGS
ncbi:hypothetical protein Q1695_008278 [Nippostrongylus brasiliensis]|nr:hypothetical protein Q1695_008278 [Nippostrongylus brasiliensis]